MNIKKNIMFLRGLFQENSNGYGVDDEKAYRLGTRRPEIVLRQNSIVQIAIDWLTRAVSQGMLSVERDEGELLTEHPLLDLWGRPNNLHTPEALVRAVITDLLFHGNAYIIKERDNRLAPSALWYANADNVVIQPSGDYYYRGDKIDADNIIHFRYGIQRDSVRLGVSPLATLYLEALTDNEASEYTFTILKTLGRPGLIGYNDSEDVEVSPEAAKAIEARLNAMTTGSRRGSTLFLSDKVRFEHLGFNPSELDLGKLREMSEERVCAALGLNPGVLGLHAGMANSRVGATLQQMTKNSYENGAIPLQNLIAQTLTHALLPDFEPRPERVRLVYDNSEVGELQEDTDALARRISMLWRDGLLTREEAREGLGYDSVGVGEYYGQVNAPLTLGLSHAFARKEGGWVGRMTGRVKALPAAIEAELEREVENVLEAVGVEIAQDYVNNPSAPVQVLIAAVALEARLFPIYQRAYREAYRAAFTTFNNSVGVNIAPSDSSIERVVRERLRALDFEQKTARLVGDVIAEGAREGRSTQAVAEELADIIPKGRWGDSGTRARIIARTEMGFAENFAAIDFAKEAEGLVMLMAADNQTDFNDPECRERDGRIFTPEQAENVMRSEHPNGTLQLTPINR